VILQVSYPTIGVALQGGFLQKILSVKIPTQLVMMYPAMQTLQVLTGTGSGYTTKQSSKIDK